MEGFQQEPRGRVLVVDSDVLLARASTRALERAGYTVDVVHAAADGARQLDSSLYDALILDLDLPDGGSWSLFDRASGLEDPPAVIVVTSYPEVTDAVEALRRAAKDFLAKPLDLADLRARLDRILGTSRQRVARESSFTPDAPVIFSEAMKNVIALCDRVAATPSSSALILGESGVGKEIVAARIHERSARRGGPFVRVNLAAMPEAIIESELFGSVRGAYTDSKRDRPGLLASAHDGTLLLDELCEFKIELQPKLLRALAERRYFPVGSDHERNVNVRILAATNRDIEDAIASGYLREDLYYRLSTIVIEVPPLRERPEDVIPLANHFITIFAAEFGRNRPALTRDAEECLLAYAWPGNVRELERSIERALMVSDGPALSFESLRLGTARRSATLAQPAVTPSTTDLPLKLDAAKNHALEAIEREHIGRVLKLAKGSRVRAAELLGVSRTTLWEKLKRYGMQG